MTDAPKLPRHRLASLPVFGTPNTPAAPPPEVPAEVEAEPADEMKRSPGERVAAFDGLRALAVSAVLLYHAGVGWAPGGFLGVDIFFVLSGYLITGLLANEYLESGGISLRRFYYRRARRLLPALFTVLAGVSLLVVFHLPQEAAAFRADVAASVGYVTNWWFVLQGQSYFGATGRPSLLLHLWSLAVEEQFYLLWPLFFVVMLDRGALGVPVDRVRALWRAIGWATLLAIGSVALAAMLYSPWRDPSRIYYGTDTRAFELLIGVVLALAKAARADRADRPQSRIRTGARDVASVVSLGVLLAAIASIASNAPGLYPGGLVVVCLAAAVLIQTLSVGTTIGAVLALRPLVWLGERSYALYLWHWPIFDVTRPGFDVTWSAPVVFTVRIALAVALAELTHRFIEQPIRGGALGRIAGRCGVAVHERRWLLPATAITSALALVGSAFWLVEPSAVPRRSIRSMRRRSPRTRARRRPCSRPGRPRLHRRPSVRRPRSRPSCPRRRPTRRASPSSATPRA